MPHILVADQIAEAGLEALRAESCVTFDVQHGLSPEDLASCIGHYDGVLIRSAVKITQDTLKNPGQLMAIARAGVGVDNVDLEAATTAGVLVMNTPDANTVSTAEHTFAMMLSLYRRIPDAHAHVRSGQWDRKAYQGHQLSGQLLGIVGFGRIGRAVAQRALAFEMKVLAYDPFVSQQSAYDGAVRITNDLDELLREADCITLHASLNDETRHMIGANALEKMKSGARLINCARGLLIDEQALNDALHSGHLGGAALDVYEHEPPKDSPLLTAPNVVLAPHLAASTVEAQQRVSIDAVETLLAYLLRGEICSAVNVTGMPGSLTPRGRAFVDLCSRAGAILSPWCSQGVERVRLTVYSESLNELAPTLVSQLLVSIVGPHLQERLNMVNAKAVAQSRGITVDHVAHSLGQGQQESILAVVESRGEKHEVEGTVFQDGRPRIMAIDNYRMELVPEGPMALIFNDDQPGVIGLVGQNFGNAKINIADMALSRRGDRALMVLKLDKPMPDEMRDALVALSPPIRAVRRISLPAISRGMLAT